MNAKDKQNAKSLKIIKVFSWMFLGVGTFTLVSTIFFGYLKRPELIGTYFLPIEFFSDDMKDIYLPLTVSTLFILSSFFILKRNRKGYYLLLITIVLNCTIYFFEIHNFPVRSILQEFWLGILIRLIFYGVPVFLLLKILKSKDSKE